MRFGVLGPVELTVGGRPVAPPGARARTLLAHLLVEPGRPVPVDRLADLLWGETATRNALQTRVSALRGVLDDAEPGARGLLVLVPGGYRLAVDADDVDAGRFRALLGVARAETDPGVRRARLTEALALWRGPAFAEPAEEATGNPHGAARLAGAAAALEEERLAALEDLAEARLALSEHAAVAAELAAEVRGHPARERLRAAHLRALAGAGRQADALAGFRELREHLATEVGVDPGPQLVALHRDLLAQSPELMTPSARPMEIRPQAHPSSPVPPPVDAVIGRAEEIATIRGLIARHRVVTLTGPGGVGKTRLALAVAGELGPSLAEGARAVALADVAPGAGSDRIAAEVYRALGLRGPDPSAPSVGDALGDREVLMVLDNGEHLVDGLAVLVAAIVRSTRSARVLVTSQEPLAVAGEVVLPVAPLPCPSDAPASSAAAHLFVERARAAGAVIDLDDPAQAAVVGEICRRLDGLPLALELAAARVRGLGLRGVAAGTDDRFRVFARGRRDAPARHRSLAATFDWAWRLLAGDERAALRRLAVTAGGVERAAAGVVVAAAEDADDVLARLVERSWVELDAGRYRLLESVAAYAAERLGEAGEADAVRLRHAEHFVVVAEVAAAGVRTSAAPIHLAVLAAEAPNLRRAHEAALRLAPALAVRLVDALAWPWLLTGRHHEAFALAEATPPDPPGVVREWTEVLALVCTVPGSGGEPCVHGTAARAAVHAEVAVHFGDAPRARLALEQADRLATAEGDVWAAAVVGLVRAVQAVLSGDLDGAVAHATTARAAFDGIGDRWGSARAATVLAQVALARDDLDAADARYAAALADVRALGLWPDVAAHLAGRGRVALMRGDLDVADALHGEAHAVAREHGDLPGQEHAAIGLGLAARRRGDLDAAERHLGAWLEWNRRVEADHGLALVSSHLGFVAEQRGYAEVARAHHEEALAAATRAGDPRARALAQEGLAGAEALAGEHRRAGERLAEAAALRREHGGPLLPAERADLDRVERRLADAAQRGAGAAARLP